MLSRLAIRIATVEALKGKTLVGNNVLDSEIGALDVAADGSIRTDTQKPFLSVYTDGSKAEGDLDARALHDCGRLDLTIEAGITAAMVETDPDTGESRIAGIGIPAADPAMEMYLDCVDRQVVTALTDPDNEWADLWRGLSLRAVTVERRRTADATGVRIAAHQTVIALDLLPEPAMAEPLEAGTPFDRFLAKLDAARVPNPDYDGDDPESPETIADPVMTAKATLIRSLLSGSWRAWEASQIWWGLSRDELRALGLGPLAGDAERVTPELDAGTTDIEGAGSAVTVVQPPAPEPEPAP